MLTVPEAARRTGKNPETIRRWIREGRLRAHKVGTQHVFEEEDLADALGLTPASMALPEQWKHTFWGGPMPDWAAIVRQDRDEH
jgi:excisionase family DNA binding protein